MWQSWITLDGAVFFTVAGENTCGRQNAAGATNCRFAFGNLLHTARMFFSCLARAAGTRVDPSRFPTPRDRALSGPCGLRCSISSWLDWPQPSNGSSLKLRVALLRAHVRHTIQGYVAAVTGTVTTAYGAAVGAVAFTRRLQCVLTKTSAYIKQSKTN
jgi:hypothetical protein